MVATFYLPRPGPLDRPAHCSRSPASPTGSTAISRAPGSSNRSSAAFLDPIADKLLVAAVLFMLAATTASPPTIVLPALVILMREILVSGLREHLAGLRVGVPVPRLAKWKTGIQMVAIGVLLVGDAGPAFLPPAIRRGHAVDRRAAHPGHRLWTTCAPASNTCAPIRCPPPRPPRPNDGHGALFRLAARQDRHRARSGSMPPAASPPWRAARLAEAAAARLRRRANDT